MTAGVSRRRAGELVRGVFKILLPHSAGLPVREIFARLEKEVPPSEFESSEYRRRPGLRRYEKTVRFNTILAVKAGWLVKNQGVWFLTSTGRDAYEQFGDPEEFLNEAIRLYKDWKDADKAGGRDAPLPTTAGFDQGDRFVWEPGDVEIIAPGAGNVPGSSQPVALDTERRGSPPVFKRVEYSLAKLIQDIEIGEIGLPDIQRPFVWPNTKVRDLFDSMYRGFPVGYLLFWATAVPEGHRQIGADQKQKVPQLVIVDGQQRLTSLYAVITGTPVLKENYAKEGIQIGFSPVSERFEVTDPTIRRDPEFIPDISEIWKVPPIRFVRHFVERLRQRRVVTEDEEDRLAESIDRVYDLRSYPFTALELSSTVGEEHVAEVFVRINSQGTQLSQADFILTLMSVFWDKGRRALEEFSRAAREPSRVGPSPFNYFIQPAPDQLLRVSVGLAFRRARLQHVYSILRGKDLATGEFSAERRTEQFHALELAQEYVLDLQSWHEFFKAVMQAGFRHGGMVSSKTGLMYCYLMFLIGKRNFRVDTHTLRGVIARWFFMTALTGRYTGSPETVMERDLARLEEVGDASAFVRLLDRIVDETLTSDYWNIGLPNELATSSPLSPSLSAYHAALVLLDAKALFSKLKVSELLDPSVRAKRAAVERHHLFPKGYLAKLGITRPRDTNQIANMALVEWPDNAAISATSPSEYWPTLSAGVARQDLQEMMFAHGLFEGWDRLEYAAFLEKRRKLMATVIAEGFRKLGGGGAGLLGDRETEEKEERLLAARSRGRSTQELIESGESAFVEFKESSRWSHIHGEKEKTSEMEVIRALAGFLNARGGSLILGVNDQGEVVGLAKDFKSIQGRPNRDGFENWLTGLLRERIGGAAVANLSARFDVINTREICRIDAEAAPAPVFVEDRHFFLRLGNTTQNLNMRDAQDYIRSRWPQF
jgi:hypothetical protein